MQTQLTETSYPAWEQGRPTRSLCSFHYFFLGNPLHLLTPGLTFPHCFSFGPCSRTYLPSEPHITTYRSWPNFLSLYNHKSLRSLLFLLFIGPYFHSHWIPQLPLAYTYYLVYMAISRLMLFFFSKARRPYSLDNWRNFISTFDWHPTGCTLLKYLRLHSDINTRSTTSHWWLPLPIHILYK